MRRPSRLHVADADAVELMRWTEGHTSSETIRRRARIVLLSGEGVAAAAIADRLGCSRQTVVTWRERYRRDGLAGLRDQPRSGRPAAVDPAAVVVRTLGSPPPDLDRWTVRSLAAEMGISSTVVAEVWRGWGIAAEVGGVVLLTDPVIDRHVLGVAGMYVDPQLQVLAVATGAAVSDTVVPDLSSIDARPVLGGRLSRLTTMTERGCPGAFFDRLSRVRGASVVISEESLGEAEGRWPRELLHVVRRPARWQRVARVACLLAGGTVSGSVAVRALGQALDRHRHGTAFCWSAIDHASASAGLSPGAGSGARRG